MFSIELMTNNKPVIYVYKQELVIFFVGLSNPSFGFSTAMSKSKLNYKFHTLKVATQNFNDANKVGQGGSGSVYKVISIFIYIYLLSFERPLSYLSPSLSNIDGTFLSSREFYHKAGKLQ